jgi:aryl-alcohol dehydrogenase-like predicted oxidoreductase
MNSPARPSALGAPGQGVTDLRTLGRLGWRVSAVGYGMWSMGGDVSGWTGGSDEEHRVALQEAVSLGCNFFDTAWIYGRGHSESLLGELRRANPTRKLYCATKLPPKDRHWPSTRASKLEDVFPPDHIKEYTEKSLKNLGVDRIDLLQFHVWEDAWANDERWQRAIADLKSQGLVAGVGVSVNRWEPWNGIATLRTGLIDTVQVIYNIFDQAPEDELFALCKERSIGIIARVPFDEGSLTGTLTLGSRFPEGDFRATYFGPENLPETVRRVEALKKIVPGGMTLPEMALRFILSHPMVGTVIPGMRKVAHVHANMATGDGKLLPDGLMKELRKYRWNREPAPWSD